MIRDILSFVSQIMPTFAGDLTAKRDNEKNVFIGSATIHGTEAEVRKRVCEGAGGVS